MKFLVVGLGSMGKRRVRNLQSLKAEQIIGFDIRDDRRQESEHKYGIRTFKDFESAMREDPEALVISTPPDKHHEYALLAAKANKHFFTEINFLREGMDDLVEIGNRKDIAAVPSFTMPHHPSIKLLRKMLSEGKVGKPLCFSYHFGNYLPDWHGWEDYRQVYFSRKDTPGCKEVVGFELTWLLWLLGDVRRVSCFKAKLSNLETDVIDDVYQVILEFKCGILGNMLIDVVSRSSGRQMTLLGQEGTLYWNSQDGLLKAYDAQKEQWEEYPEDEGVEEPGYSIRLHEEIYVEEMNDFVEAAKGASPYPSSFQKEKEIVDLVEAIDKSAQQNISVEA